MSCRCRSAASRERRPSVDAKFRRGERYFASGRKGPRAAVGTREGTRTPTPVKAVDFESTASTDSATRAHLENQN